MMNTGVKIGEVGRGRAFLVYVLLLSCFALIGLAVGSPQALVPGMVYGQIFDEVGSSLDGVALSITGNESDLLWTGVSDYNPNCPCHGVYNTGHTLNWSDGELLTLRIINESDSGYGGFNTSIAPSGGLVRMDVHADSLPWQEIRMASGWNLVSIAIFPT